MIKEIEILQLIEEVLNETTPEQMKAELVEGFWVIGTNKWSANNYAKEQAEKYSLTLVNCKNCIDCRDCRDCSNCTNCSFCGDCRDCSNCRFCSSCTNCSYCHDCSDCRDCRNCSDLYDETNQSNK